MRIEIEKDYEGEVIGIEGYCNIPGWIGDMAVVRVSKLNVDRKTWHVAHSMALPSDVKAAKIVSDCYQAVLEKINQ